MENENNGLDLKAMLAEMIVAAEGEGMSKDVATGISKFVIFSFMAETLAGPLPDDLAHEAMIYVEESVKQAFSDNPFPDKGGADSGPLRKMVQNVRNDHDMRNAAMKAYNLTEDGADAFNIAAVIFAATVGEGSDGRPSGKDYVKAGTLIWPVIAAELSA